ncbi:hypothetical protein FB451DRAFT_1192559 [Mycena latifolia]|nr:hypothetical protein FB451DRAFT_1192559 [Mycena latifolia]
MKAFPSASVLAVAAAASLILPATAVAQVGEGWRRRVSFPSILILTVRSIRQRHFSTPPSRLTQAGPHLRGGLVYAALAPSPGGDSRCGDTIIGQFRDASVNFPVALACLLCGDAEIEMTQAADTALTRPWELA